VPRNTAATNKAMAAMVMSDPALRTTVGEMAGAPGFEPGNGGIKIRCLTTWLRPNRRGGVTYRHAHPDRNRLHSVPLRPLRCAEPESFIGRYSSGSVSPGNG
jgi:hypothetical protein